MELVAALRMLERLLAVGIGGMAIYLGYRLFLALPEIRDASGEFRLPLDIRVVLGRVGPGAFFALFGAAVVALSLHAAVRYDFARSPANAPADTGSSVEEAQAFLGLGRQHATNDAAAAQREDARKLLQRDMTELNALPGKLQDDLPEPDRAEVAELVRRVKLKLLRPVWEEQWGNPQAFEEWLASDNSGAPGPLAEPAALFFYGTSRQRP